jgi:hypothetical protein
MKWYYSFIVVLLSVPPILAQERIPVLDSVLHTLNNEEKLKFFQVAKFLKYTENAAQKILYAHEYLALAEKLQRKEHIAIARFSVIVNEHDGTRISADDTAIEGLMRLFGHKQVKFWSE